MTEQGKHRSALEDLVIGHFDGNLSEDQERELAKAIAESPDSKRLFLSYMRMEGRLHSLGRDGFLREAHVQDVNTAERSNEGTLAIESNLVSNTQHRESRFSRSRIWSTSTSVAVCAALIALLSWGLWPSSLNASTVLQRAQQAAADLVDRAYRVTISGSVRKDVTLDQELMIHIRDDRHFVIQPTDGIYQIGRDGSDYWFAQQSGPVWVTEDYQTLAPELQRKIPNRGLLGIAASPDEPLLMNVSSLLAMIETSYDTELIDSSSTYEHHIRATLKSRRNNRPSVIEVWADAKSSVVLRTELKWNNSRLARFELVDSPPLSDQWYQYSRRTADREVIRLDSTP